MLPRKHHPRVQRIHPVLFISCSSVRGFSLCWENNLQIYRAWHIFLNSERMRWFFIVFHRSVPSLYIKNISGHFLACDKLCKKNMHSLWSKLPPSTCWQVSLAVSPGWVGQAIALTTPATPSFATWVHQPLSAVFLRRQKKDMREISSKGEWIKESVTALCNLI